MSTNNTKQAFWVAIGRFCAFLVGIVSPMILSRFFDKGDYGTYKQVMYVYNSLLFVFTLGLPQSYAYFIPKVEKAQVKDVIDKITRIFFVLGAIFSLVLFFCSGLIANLLENPELNFAIRIFAPVPLFLLPTIGMEGIFASFQKSQVLVLYTVITKVMTVLFIVLPVVLFNGTYINALIGFNIASLITCVITLYMKSWLVKGYPRKKTDITYRIIFKFSIPLFYASIWGMILASANQFFISRFFGNEVFAEFSNGFMEIPVIGMIIGGVGTILLPVFSGMDKGVGMTDDIRGLWISALEKSAKIIFPILIYSIIFAEVIITCMYGNLYENSAIYFQIKNIGGLIFIIPFSPIILAIGKTKEYADVHMVTAILVVVLEYLSVKLTNNPISIAVVYEVCQCVKIILLLKVISNYSNKSIFQMIPGKNLLKYLFAAILAALASYVVLMPFKLNKFAILFISLALYVMCYYILCWIFRVSYKSIAVSLVPKIKSSSVLKFIP